MSDTFYRTDPRLKNFRYERTYARNYGKTEDKEGNLWVCTSKGIKIYESASTGKRNTLLEETLPAQLKNLATYDILMDDNGFWWIGTSQGLWQRNPNTKKFRLFSHNQNDSNSIGKGPVYQIIKDSQGELWFGGFESGLNRMDIKTNKVTHYRHDPNDSKSIGSNGISSIIEDKSGNIWIGNIDFGGVNRFIKDKESFINYLGVEQKGLVSIQNLQTQVLSMKGGRNGKIYYTLFPMIKNR